MPTHREGDLPGRTRDERAGENDELLDEDDVTEDLEAKSDEELDEDEDAEDPESDEEGEGSGEPPDLVDDLFGDPKAAGLRTNDHHDDPGERGGTVHYGGGAKRRLPKRDI